MDHRTIERRTFTYYMQALDSVTGKLVGHLSDISDGGFKLDSRTQIPPEKDFRLFINLSKEVADKTMLTFVARSKWCKQDPLDPMSYVVGFQIIGMSPADQQIFHRMFEKYGVRK
jgi:hypothetical protein